MGEVRGFKSKKQQAVDELLREILNGKPALILFLNDQEDGTYLSDILVKCTAQDALLMMDMARPGIQELAVQEFTQGIPKGELQ